MKNSRFKAMTLTEAAAARVLEVIANADKPIVGLRVGVRNGGCAGMSYTMEFAENASPLDEVVEDKGVKLLIDPKALLFLLGSQMDFKVDTLSSNFRLQEPERDLSLRLWGERGHHTGRAGSARRVGLTPFGYDDDVKGLIGSTLNSSLRGAKRQSNPSFRLRSLLFD